MKPRQYLPLIGLVIAVTLLFLFTHKKEVDELTTYESVFSDTFGDRAEYVNKQARFSIQYPHTWKLEVKNLEHEERGVRVRGKQGYIDLFWGQKHEKGKCPQPFKELEIKNGTIEACNFVQKDNSEIWNEIVKDRGDLVFWANAYAASPSAQTRSAILEVFSTLEFQE